MEIIKAERGAEAERQQRRGSSGVCRCCLLEGTFGTMERSYCWRGHTQTYSDMLRYVFGITFPWDAEDQLICSVCEIRLRQAFTFWRQVLDSNKKFIKAKPAPMSEDHNAGNTHSFDDDAITQTRNAHVKSSQFPKLAQALLNNSVTQKPKQKSQIILTPKLSDVILVKTKHTLLNSAHIKRIPQSDISTDNAGGTQAELSEGTNNDIEKQKSRRDSQIILTPYISDEMIFKMKHVNGINYTTLNCMFCCELFESELDLNRHSLTCELRSKKILPKKCSFCPTMFEPDAILISQHMWIEHRYKTEYFNQPWLKCDICDKDFSNIKKKVMHVRHSHHTCHKCRKTFFNMYEKNYHMLSHTVSTPNLPKSVFRQGSTQCPECKKTFVSEKLYQDHVHINHDSKYSCEKCKERFIDEKSMLQHKIEAHGQPILSHPISVPNLPQPVRRKGPRQCPECKEVFATAKLCCVHVYKIHGYKCYTCGMCGERFRTENSMLRHKVDAHGRPMLKCGACDNSYNSKYMLNIHQRMHHLQEKNFSCPNCDYVAFCKSRIKNHMLSHTKEKHFVCPHCSKRFSRKSTLTCHKRIHTGDKRKVCKVCGQAFVQRASLKYHLEKHHPGQL